MQQSNEPTTSSTTLSPTAASAAASVAVANGVHLENFCPSRPTENQHMNTKIDDEMVEAEYMKLLDSARGMRKVDVQAADASSIEQICQILGGDQQGESGIHPHFQHNHSIPQGTGIRHDIQLQPLFHQQPETSGQLHSPHSQQTPLQLQSPHQQHSPHQEQQNVYLFQSQVPVSPHQIDSQRQLDGQVLPSPSLNMQAAMPRLDLDSQQLHNHFEQRQQQHGQQQHGQQQHGQQQHGQQQHGQQQHGQQQHGQQQHGQQQHGQQQHGQQQHGQHSGSPVAQHNVALHQDTMSHHQTNKEQPVSHLQQIHAMDEQPHLPSQAPTSTQSLITTSPLPLVHHFTSGQLSNLGHDRQANQPHFQQNFIRVTEASVTAAQYRPTNTIPASSDYRNNPPDLIDDTSVMAFTEMDAETLALQNDLSMLGDDIAFVNSPSRPVMAADFDAVTISALLEPSQRINIKDDQMFISERDYDESPRKMSRVGSHSDESSVNYEKLFNADANSGQVTNANFTFEKFGMDITNVGGPTQLPSPNVSDSNSSQFGQQTRQEPEKMITTPSITQPIQPHPHVSPKTSLKEMKFTENLPQISPPSFPLPHSRSNRSPRRNHVYKSPPLNHSFADRHGGIVLKMLKQPESQHRARYMTEGSRGAVKDTEQQGHPVVQLLGWNEDAKLEVFIGVDSGKVKPHGFYQACRISGKNASSSRERQIDGTNVIELEFDKTKRMTATIDCIGILKLRNTDVEKRIGLVKNKKKSTKCRLICRVNLCLASGTHITLQTASTVIACTQPAGQPEVCRMSLEKSPLSGGQSLFVIGKNFVKGFRVKFQEVLDESDVVLWEQEAEIEHEFTHTTHFICTVPPYKVTSALSSPVTAQVIVMASGGVSEPVPFTYESDEPTKDTATPTSCTSMSGSPQATTSPMTTSASASNNNSPPMSIVAPEALELVAQLQQQSSTNSSKIFQIPNGIDFISQDSGGVNDEGAGGNDGYKGATDFSSDFKPITLGNGLVNSAKFYTGPPLTVDNHNTFSPSDS